MFNIIIIITPTQIVAQNRKKSQKYCGFVDFL